MPKSQFIDPAEIRKPGVVDLGKIELNQYKKSFAEEKKLYGKDALLGIYQDMQFIREFETMLFQVRTQKHYNGIDYLYTGPAHLYTGEEAQAVGMAYNLTKDDMIFGSHRSHGEVLAKGFNAIRNLPEKELMNIMESFFGGDLLRVVEKYNKSGNVRDLALDYLLYGFMAELFGRANGFTRGLGNSMHVFFLPFGIYPNNAIVGGSAGISVGAALYKKVNKKPGMVVCNCGDGAMARGPVWEALNFASMDQYFKLWDKEFKGGLPVIFHCINNGYGMGGQTRGETMAYDIAARIGSGVRPDALHAERIDGYDPLAVIDAFKRKREILAKNEGPVFLETVTYRYVGHSATDSSSYRTQEEIEAWREQDSIAAFRAKLVKGKIAGDDAFEGFNADIKERITRIMKLAIDEQISPRIDPANEPDAMRKYMLSNEHVEKFDDRKPDVTMPLEENSNLKKIQGKKRFGYDENGKEVSKLMAYNVRDALFEAIINKFYTDPTLIAFGEDNRDWGGAYGVYRGLTEAIPYHRFFNAPISESAIVAAACGYALCGGRAIPELMYCDFLGCAGDEVFNQLSKWQAMSAGVLKMPVVLRVSVGAKYGAQHAQDWTSLCAHIPGLKVCFPATPYDAKGLMNAALSGTDPVVFFESQKLYDTAELFHEGGVPEGYYEVAIGEPDVKRVGSDLTILSIGATLYPAMKAAKEMSEKYGIETEVIDARSLVPFNYDKLIESVKKTGRLLLISDACERGSFLNDVAANVTRMAFDYLDAPPVVVGAPNSISPCPELESFYYPQASWVLDAVNEAILPLPGYTSQMNFTRVEKLRRAKLGI
ncbi:MAG: dehydrogenase [Lentisphaeria bacterium]|nr:dehydrogenase [Lentisphaeria bacterium]